MPPRPVPLAYAGRKLTGPPEGYDRKKELQVKKWLSTVGPAAAAEASGTDVGAGSVVSVSEVGGQLEPELDDLYGDLKDSTDGDLVPALAGRPAGGQGVAAKPPKQAPRPVQDAATLVSTSAPFSPPAGKAQPLLGTEAQYVGLTVAGAGQAQGAKLHTADSHPLPPSPSGQGSGSTGTPTLSLTPTPSPPLSPAPLAAATGAAAPGPQHQSVAGSAASRPPKVPRDQVAPLEAAYDLLPADPPHQRLVAQLAVPSPDPDEERQAVAAGASLLLARAEAAAAALAGAGPPSEVDKYKAALLMAVKEKHRLGEEVRGELAAARAAATSATQEAARKAAAAAADASSAAKRAADAEAALAQVRAELARVHQDAKVRRFDVEDREEEHQAEVARLKQEVASALAKLNAQGDSREQALRQAQEEALAARQAAAAIDRQYKHLRRQHDLDRSKAEMEAATLRSELAARESDLAALRADKQRLLDNWQAEVAARLAAEESERKAIKAATKQVEIAGSLATARQAAAALQHVASASTARIHAVRGGDASGSAPPAAAPAPAPAKGPVAHPAPFGAGPGAGHSPRDMMHQHQPHVPGAAAGGQQQRRATAAAGAGAAANGAAAGGAGGASAGTRGGAGVRARSAGGLGDAHRLALEQEYDEVELRRLDAHRAMSRALAADRMQLGEAQRQQKRALLAAQLEDSRAVQEALALAPEQLRALGLAFRVSLVGLPSQFSSPTSPGAELAQQLGQAGYRTYADPLLVTQQPPPIPAPPGLEVPPSAPLVPVSAALVLVGSPGLAASPPHAAAISTAAERGVPMHLVCLPHLTSLQQLTQPAAGDAARSAAQGGEEGGGGPALSSKAAAALAAAWEQRIALGGGGGAGGGGARGGAAPAPGHVQALCSRLGMTDTELLGVPMECLRRISVDKALCHPDLLTLNSPRLTHLKVSLARDAPGPSPAAAASAGAADAADAGSPQRPAATQHQAQHQAHGVALASLLAIIKGNRTLTALTVKGAVGVEAARALATALLAAPSSCIASLTVGSPPLEVPVAGLLGRPAGITPLHTLDLSDACDAFGPEAAAVLDVLLSSPACAARAHLSNLRLPGTLSNAFNTPQGQEVALRLATTLASLTRSAPAAAGAAAGGAAGAGAGVLQRMNDVPVPALPPPPSAAPPAQAASGAPGSSTPRGAPQAPGGPSGASVEVEVDWSAGVLGPIVASALVQCAVAAGALGPALEALNLTGCRLAPGGAAQLAAAAGHGPLASGGGTRGMAPGALGSLRVACLADNRLGPQGVELVCGALGGAGAGGGRAAGGPKSGAARGHALTVLDLSVNALADEGAKALAAHLRTSAFPSLEVLALGNNLIQVEGARALASGLAGVPRLTELALGGNTLGDGGAAAVAEACARLPHLRVLQLQENYSIGPEGSRALGALLTSTSTLQELELGSNHLGVEGARHLAHGLSANASLTRLELQRCKLRSEGVCHLAAALGTNHTLTDLGLARNGAGDLGTKALVEALQRNTTLVRLDLRANALGLVACRLLGTLLRERNVTLRHLLLASESQHVDQEADRPVFEALQLLAASTRALPAARPLLAGVPPLVPTSAPSPAGPSAPQAATASSSTRPTSAGPASQQVGQQRAPPSPSPPPSPPRPPAADEPIEDLLARYRDRPASAAPLAGGGPAAGCAKVADQHRPDYYGYTGMREG